MEYIPPFPDCNNMRAVTPPASPSLSPTSTFLYTYPCPHNNSGSWQGSSHVGQEAPTICQRCGTEYCDCDRYNDLPHESINIVMMNKFDQGGFGYSMDSGWDSQSAVQGLWDTNHSMVVVEEQQQTFTNVFDTASGSEHRMNLLMNPTRGFGNEPYAATVNGDSDSALQDANLHIPTMSTITDNFQPSIETQLNNIDPNTRYPIMCSIPMCRTKKFIRSLAGHRAHIKNVHGKHLCCEIEGCPVTEPFTNKNSRERHYNTVHAGAPKNYRCERPNCGMRVKAWIRKDKLLEHNKRHHSSISCQMCAEFFDNEEELIEHTNVEHGYTHYGHSHEAAS